MSDDNVFDEGGSDDNVFAEESSGENVFTEERSPEQRRDDQTQSLQQRLVETGVNLGLVGAPPGELMLRAPIALSTRVIDILSRGEFAFSAFVKSVGQEGFDPLHPTAKGFQAAGRELLSGVAGIQGKKQILPEVVKELGAPDLGSLSGFLEGSQTFSPVAKFVFSETGEGLKLKKGGALDPTGLGTILLPARFATDPLIFTSFGAGSAGELAIRGMSKTAVEQFASKSGRRLLKEELKSIAPLAAKTGSLDVAAMSPTGKKILKQVSREAAQSKAISSHVDEVAEDMIRSGIQPGSAIHIGVRAVAKQEAEERVLAAGRYLPGLLDRGGMKFAGRTVPGTPAFNAAMSKGSRKVIDVVKNTRAGHAAIEVSAKPMRKITEDILPLFVGGRTFHIRNLPGAKAMETAAHNSQILIANALNERLVKAVKPFMVSAVRPRARKAAKESIRKIQRVLENTMSPQRLSEQERVAADALRRLLDDVRVREIIEKMPGVKGGREAYFPQFYDNTAEELQVLFKDSPRLQGSNAIDWSNLGRFNEVRTFDNFVDARKWAAAQRRLDPGLPELKPVDDVIEAIRRRIEGHATALSSHRYYQDLAKFYGRVPVDDVSKRFLLASPVITEKLTAAQSREFFRVTAAAKVDTPAKFLEGISRDGRKEFFRQRFSRIQNGGELNEVMQRYASFLDDIPKQRSLNGQLAPDGTHYVPFDAFEQFRGLEIPQSLALQLQGADRKIFTNKRVIAMLNRVDRITNIMRTGVYTVWPSAQFRNKYSNVAMGLAAVGIGYLDPRLMKQMLQIRAGMKGSFKTGLGDRVTFDQFRSEMRQFGVEITGRQAMEQQTLGQAITRGPNPIQRVIGAIENSDRTQLALYYRRAGFDPDQVGVLSNKFMLDYQDLGAFDREVLKRVFLFPTFARKEIPLLVRQLRTNPGRLDAIVKPFIGRESEDAEMTSWEADALKIRLEKNGRELTVLTGIDLPIRQLDLVWRGGAARTMAGTIAMMTPPLKIGAEGSFKTHAFTGKRFSRVESQMIGRFLDAYGEEGTKNWLGYLKETDAAGKPKYTFNGQKFYYLFQSYALSRFISTSDRQFREFLNDDNYVGMFLDIFTGLRFKTLDLDEQQERLKSERRRLVIQAAKDRGLIRGGEFLMDVEGETQ